MIKNKKKFSLKTKMSLVILIGCLLSLSIYFLWESSLEYVVDKYYLTDNGIESREKACYEDLQRYVTSNKLSSDDTNKISKWLKKQDYVYMALYKNGSIIYESGWWDESSEENDTKETSLEKDKTTDDQNNYSTESYESSYGYDSSYQDYTNIIKFSDTSCETMIVDFSEYKYYDIFDTVGLVLCFIILLLITLLYTRHLTNRIINLSGEVEEISGGRFDKEITIKSTDEIATLAIGVEKMRISVIERLQGEQDAWDANCELITSMSHDIRTPLTSLIGYLDIIESKKYKSNEELEKYICSSRDKAFQLKNLSDKLFQYFLVFGNQNKEIKLEPINANILFEQIFGEHTIELRNNGFKFQVEVSMKECSFMTEVTYLRRIFDNLFSNILKYADNSEDIVIKVLTIENKLYIEFSNTINKNFNKVESTRIGLKTCETIANTLHGKFCYEVKENIFNTHIEFQLIKGEKNIE